MNNNFMIEGVDNNNKTVTGPLVYVPTEATAEFTLLQNQVGAEFGHSTGGQFNTVIKSGTNEMHGSLYEYFQNRNLNAVDRGLRQPGHPQQSALRPEQAGRFARRALIKKTSCSISATCEYARSAWAARFRPRCSAPTAAGFRGTGQDDRTSPRPTTRSSSSMFPPPPWRNGDTTTVNGVDIPIGILPISGANYTNFYTFLGSVDYNMSTNDQIRGRFINNKSDVARQRAPICRPSGPPCRSGSTWSRWRNTTPSRPTLTNELRLAFNRFSQFYTVPGNVNYPGLDVFPNITFDNDLGLAASGPIRTRRSTPFRTPISWWTTSTGPRASTPSSSASTAAT